MEGLVCRHICYESMRQGLTPADRLWVHQEDPLHLSYIPPPASSVLLYGVQNLSWLILQGVTLVKAYVTTGSGKLMGREGRKRKIQECPE